ncbi:hypothetical protein HAPAU_42090 [Halalkalicoccus paucihalophilus]|uniref:Uncharacterized protein n=1 Tax=Halalkalicoccus paucihalophilus TaxID=1008153 RepID=A0A151A7Y4_9EURY|nr:hypothetical protein [Halalkalicoccus paucihalophilus]KYH23729.1 hypothetical protein HAPAU_42090 [Halalkalicoccus paucihalophilus]
MSEQTQLGDYEDDEADADTPEKETVTAADLETLAKVVEGNTNASSYPALVHF